MAFYPCLSKKKNLPRSPPSASEVASGLPKSPPGAAEVPSGFRGFGSSQAYQHRSAFLRTLANFRNRKIRASETGQSGCSRWTSHARAMDGFLGMLVMGFSADARPSAPPPTPSRQCSSHSMSSRSRSTSFSCTLDKKACALRFALRRGLPSSAMLPQSRHSVPTRRPQSQNKRRPLAE